MRIVLLASLLGAAGVSGCVADTYPGDYPVEPGGNGGAFDLGEAGDLVRGRVCRITDLVDLRSCSPDRVGGLEVTLGGFSTSTAADGGFALPRPTGSFLSFGVSGAGAVTTTTPYSPSLTVPVIDADVYARTLGSHQIFAPPGTGAILGNLVRAGRPASGFTVEVVPAGASGPFYDADPTGFTLDRTGSRGVFWVPGIALGGTNLTFRDARSGGVTTVNGIQVVNGGVTILDSVVIP